MEHFGYLFGAYSIIFAVIFIYVLFIWRRQAELERELRAMEERIKTLKLESTSSAAKPMEK
ncbi:MAG TPA: CcmD family protein [Candidatus Binataceae bacterium]|nr:CcmD family protein [Candidatus Binataceae bacterium]